MKRVLLAVAVILAVAGCQAGGESASTGSEAVAAEAPSLILEFTDETTAYQCPSCKMAFDAPGECSMNDGTLEEMAVTYNCPEDDEVFAAAGTCPTHDVAILATLTGVHMHEDGEGESDEAAGQEHEETS
jgi:hypothetical protein